MNVISQLQQHLLNYGKFPAVLNVFFRPANISTFLNSTFYFPHSAILHFINDQVSATADSFTDCLRMPSWVWVLNESRDLKFSYREIKLSKINIPIISIKTRVSVNTTSAPSATCLCRLPQPARNRPSMYSLHRNDMAYCDIVILSSVVTAG